MKKYYKFIVVDDHQLFADGLVRILEEEPDFSLQCVCQNDTQLNESLAQEVPDLILLDIQLHGHSGLDTCSRLREQYPDLQIILISMIQNPHTVNEARVRGANGYIPKTTDAAELKAVIRRIMTGEFHFIGSGDLQQEMNAEHEKISQLSKRELEIIALVKNGLTSRVIAEQLFLSEYTIETHRKNILRKLQLSTATELVSYAYANHL